MELLELPILSTKKKTANGESPKKQKKVASAKKLFSEKDLSDLSAHAKKSLFNDKDLGSDEDFDGMF